MRKLKLHLDDLAVSTFHTLPERDAVARGTLIGHQAAAVPPTTDCFTHIPPTQVNCPTQQADCPTNGCFTLVLPTHHCDTRVCLTGTGA